MNAIEYELQEAIVMSEDGFNHEELQKMQNALNDFKVLLEKHKIMHRGYNILSIDSVLKNFSFNTMDVLDSDSSLGCSEVCRCIGVVGGNQLL